METAEFTLDSTPRKRFLSLLLTTLYKIKSKRDKHFDMFSNFQQATKHLVF